MALIVDPVDLEDSTAVCDAAQKVWEWSQGPAPDGWDAMGGEWLRLTCMAAVELLHGRDVTLAHVFDAEKALHSTRAEMAWWRGEAILLADELRQAWVAGDVAARLTVCPDDDEADMPPIVPVANDPS